MAISDWLTVTPDTGNSGQTTITVSASSLSELSNRAKAIRITSGNLTEDVLVKQKTSGATLSISPGMLVLPDSGGTGTLSVICSGAWTISPMRSWIQFSASAGTGSTTITVTASSNTSKSDRGATFFINSGSLQDRTDIVQYKDASLTLFPTSFNLGHNGNTQFIMVTPSMQGQTWEIQNYPDWVTAITPTSSTQEEVVTFSYGPNTSTSARTGNISFLYRGIPQQVALTQSGEQTFEISPSAVTFPQSGGSSALTITSSTYWKIFYPSFVTGPENGSGSTAITITALPNTGLYKEGVITAQTNDGLISHSINCVLDGPVFVYSPTAITANWTGGSATVNITADTAWQIISYPNWATPSTTQGSGNGSVTFTFGVNEGTNSRTESVQFRCRNRVFSVNITQKPRDLIIIPSSVTFTSALATSTTVNLISGYNWEATNVPSWVTLSQTAGTGNLFITVSVNDNVLDMDRIGSVVFTCNGQQYSLQVSQGHPDLVLSPNIIGFGLTGGTTSLYITGSTPWTITAPSWITISPSAGTGNGVVTLTVDSAATGRTGSITAQSQANIANVDIIQNNDFVVPGIITATSLTASTIQYYVKSDNWNFTDEKYECVPVEILDNNRFNIIYEHYNFPDTHAISSDTDYAAIGYYYPARLLGFRYQPDFYFRYDADYGIMGACFLNNNPVTEELIINSQYDNWEIVYTPSWCNVSQLSGGTGYTTLSLTFTNPGYTEYSYIVACCNNNYFKFRVFVTTPVESKRWSITANGGNLFDSNKLHIQNLVVDVGSGPQLYQSGNYTAATVYWPVVWGSACEGMYIKTVDLGNVDYVGNLAFASGNYIDNLIIPNTVEKIGASAFTNPITSCTVESSSKILIMGTGTNEGMSAGHPFNLNVNTFSCDRPIFGYLPGNSNYERGYSLLLGGPSVIIYNYDMRFDSSSCSVRLKYSTYFNEATAVTYTDNSDFTFLNYVGGSYYGVTISLPACIKKVSSTAFSDAGDTGTLRYASDMAPDVLAEIQRQLPGWTFISY